VVSQSVGAWHPQLAERGHEIDQLQKEVKVSRLARSA
jgi:hypothetical protein